MRNPGPIIRAASSIIAPLITNEKSPSVIRLTGIDTSIKSGLIVWLITAITKATISAVQSVPKSAEKAKTRGTPTLVI